MPTPSQQGRVVRAADNLIRSIREGKGDGFTCQAFEELGEALLATPGTWCYKNADAVIQNSET